MSAEYSSIVCEIRDSVARITLSQPSLLVKNISVAGALLQVAVQ